MLGEVADLTSGEPESHRSRLSTCCIFDRDRTKILRSVSGCKSSEDSSLFSGQRSSQHVGECLMSCCAYFQNCVLSIERPKLDFSAQRRKHLHSRLTPCYASLLGEILPTAWFANFRLGTNLEYALSPAVETQATRVGLQKLARALSISESLY